MYCDRLIYSIFQFEVNFSSDFSLFVTVLLSMNPWLKLKNISITNNLVIVDWF